MSTLSGAVVESARSRVGYPFRHHFKPDICERGEITVAACMKRGLDHEGYDCSGLVVASICEVLGLSTEEWPREYRHMNQLKKLDVAVPASIGDCLLFYQRAQHRTHIGIMATTETVVHASGVSKVVEESAVEGEIIRVGVIPVAVMLEVPKSDR